MDGLPVAYFQITIDVLRLNKLKLTDRIAATLDAVVWRVHGFSSKNRRSFRLDNKTLDFGVSLLERCRAPAKRASRSHEVAESINLASGLS